VSFYTAPWDNALEPNQMNVRQWLDNLYSKFQPIEQARWNQANIDSLFYAGAQTFINRYFNFSPQFTYQNFYFNILQQPVNMITGYQRQHRKAINYLPTDGSDSHTTDQYTRLMMHVANKGGINEQFSRCCEQSAVTGMVLAQPYLDYSGDDPAQGELKLKTWEYNSFLVDPYFRNYDMSDAQFVWCQEYISKQEAEERFPDKTEVIAPMSGSPQRYGRFYFLPENYNMARNDLLVLSYVWYRWKRKKRMLYSQQRNQFFDFGGDDNELDMLITSIPDLQPVEVEVPTWKLATVLNDQLMYQGLNPLGFDDCPFVPVFWNYEPQLNYYDLRVRGLVRTMRDSNYLLNRRIILNHDISEATINAGWMRKVGAVANEDNLKKTGQGWDIILNEGYEMTDCQKIQPSAVPESDMALADQLQSLIFATSGVNLENWSAQDQPNASSLTTMIKQAANLMVLQKYFDQWDFSLKTLGERMLQTVLYNWNAAKVGTLLGEEPSPYFYSRMFAKYKVLVEEGLDTPTQRNTQAQQMLDINQIYGREVFPPSMVIKDMNLAGKAEALEFLQQQEMQAQAVQQESQNIQHAFEEVKLKELMSKAVANIAMAKERHGRAEADIGLFEERLSEISRNRALALKDKMEALQMLISTIQTFGDLETKLAESSLQGYQMEQEFAEDREKADAKTTAMSNEFVAKLMQGQLGEQEGMQQPMQQGMQQDPQMQPMGQNPIA
jgi:hypothetical protein